MEGTSRSHTKGRRRSRGEASKNEGSKSAQRNPVAPPNIGQLAAGSHTISKLKKGGPAEAQPKGKHRLVPKDKKDRFLFFCNLILRLEEIDNLEDTMNPERQQELALLPHSERERIMLRDKEREDARVVQLRKELDAEYENGSSSDELAEEDEEQDNVQKGTASLVKSDRIASSPLNSVGESANESSLQSESSITGSEGGEGEEYDEEAFESVSCWCGQPWHGRPMIECGKCTVWYHMQCEEVEENKVPVDFFCKRCRSKKRRKRPSTSSRRGGKKKRTSTPKAASKNNPEPAPPCLQAELTPAPSPLRQETESGVASSESGSTDKGYDSLPNESESSSSRSLKKKGKKKERVQKRSSFSSSTTVNSSNTVGPGSSDECSRVASPTPPSSSQTDLHQNDVPSSKNGSHPPPILPCYAPNNDTLLSNVPTPQSLTERGLYTNSDFGESYSLAYTRQPFSSSIPVLEPQVGPKQSKQEPETDGEIIRRNNMYHTIYNSEHAPDGSVAK